MMKYPIHGHLQTLTYQLNVYVRISSHSKITDKHIASQFTQYGICYIDCLCFEIEFLLFNKIMLSIRFCSNNSFVVHWKLIGIFKNELCYLIYIKADKNLPEKFGLTKNRRYENIIYYFLFFPQIFRIIERDIFLA